MTVASSGGVLVPELLRRGVKHVEMPIDLRSPIRLLKAARRLPALQNCESFDVVHVMSAAGNLATQLMPRQTADGPRFLASPMGLQNSTNEFMLLTLLRNLLLTIRTDRVLLISEEIERAIRQLGIPQDRLVRCNINGIDVAKWGSDEAENLAIRREFGIEPDALVVTTVGALHPRKSHELFLDAAAEVAKQVPQARFLIVGQGPLLGTLQAQAKRLGIDHQVILTGERNDIRAIMGATDVYVKPGIVEGFVGITVLEAMASRKPVVAWTTRDVMAAITHDETGILVPPKDPRNLGRAIIDLLRDHTRREAIGSKGSEVVTNLFSVAEVTRNLESVYLSTLGRPMRPTQQ